MGGTRGRGKVGGGIRWEGQGRGNNEGEKGEGKSGGERGRGGAR